MSLDPSIQVSKVINGPNSYITIAIPRCCVHPAGKTFKEYEQNEEIAERAGLGFAPAQLFRLIYTIQKLVFQPHMGVAGEEKSSVNTATPFFRNKTNFEERLEQFLEFIKDESRTVLVGWRLWILIRDPHFNFELGLLNTWEKENKLKRNQKEPPSLFRPLSNKLEWIHDGISVYGDASFWDTNALGKAISLALDHANNPINTRHTLNFKRSSELFEQLGADPVYLSTESYFRPVEDAIVLNEESDESSNEDSDEVEENPFQIHFPTGCYPIKHLMRNPEIFFRLNIMDEDNGQISSKEQKKLYDNLVHGKLDEDTVMKRARSTFNGKRGDIQFLRSQMELFRSVCFHDHINAGGMIMNKWFETQRRLNPEYSITPQNIAWMDPTLSEFGNFVTRDMYLLEMVCGIQVLHREIFLCLLTSLLIGDVEKEMLRFHILFHGPPEGGKSFILEMFRKLTIPGLTHENLVQSKKANTTDTNYSGMIMTQDELNELFTGKGDGAGLADTKSMLTTGRVRSEHCWVDEAGAKKTIEIISERASPLIALTNLPTKSLSESIASRFCKILVSVQNRAEIDILAENFRIFEDPDRMAKVELTAKKWRDFAVLAFWIETMKRSGMIFEVDMSLANKIASETFKTLQYEFACNVDKRDRERIMLATKAATMYFALSKVFLSGTVIPLGTPFRDEHIIHVLPYLCSQREHFWFAISLLHDLIADPLLHIVLGAIKKIIEEESSGDEQFAWSKETKGTRDYNYWSISVSTMVQNTDITLALARKIIGSISRNLKYLPSEGSVVQIITWLTFQKKELNEFNLAGPIPGSMREFQVGKIQIGGTKYGLEISRGYVLEMIGKKTNLIQEAIKSTFDPYMKETRIVTGETMRFDDVRSLPYLFKTIEVVKPKKHLIVERPGCKRFMEDFLYYGHSKTDEIEQRFESVNENIDERFQRVWEAKIGIARQPDLEITKMYSGSYPHDWIRAHAKEFPEKTTSVAEEEEDETPVYHKRVHQEEEEDYTEL